MVRPGRDCLAGIVEVDETFIGGAVAGPRGRGALGKSLVLIAAQIDGRRLGRIRLQRIADVRHAPCKPRSPIWWSLEPRFTPMAGAPMDSSSKPATLIASSALTPIRRRGPICCRTPTKSLPCSNVGCSALIKVPSRPTIWIFISTSLLSDLTGAPRGLAACCSIASCNSLLSWHRFMLAPFAAADRSRSRHRHRVRGIKCIPRFSIIGAITAGAIPRHAVGVADLAAAEEVEGAADGEIDPAPAEAVDRGQILDGARAAGVGHGQR